MGFVEKWVDLIMKCITTVSYSVITNGERGSNFHSTRGLKQGDPLSTFLFLICSEGLSSLLRSAKKQGLLRGAKASRRGPEISHLLFADDCIMFGEASEKGARILKDILKEYESCSGQYVNFNKSTIFYNSNTRNEKREEASRVLGVRSSTCPEKYLGLPNVAIPTYAMSCFLLPKALFEMIENKIAKYWWQKGGGKRGIHWCQWRYLCRPKEEDGLGF
ncbi:reverse transcriptase [Gossypium australe]|uniref:Reverse transcriptase n=1 Tax=Gossypium australe TaxID=47621 RepID=A0A5B6WF04_9ROSI|nr:reverse transcriptase [Gossypium australe]